MNKLKPSNENLIALEACILNNKTLKEAFNEFSQGDYTFIPSGINNTVWTSNNYHVNSSNATITLKTFGYSAINWRVSSENNYDKLTIIVDGTTMVDQSSGINNGTITLDSSEEHIIQATYSKDVSTNRNEDIGELTFIE